MDDPRLSAGHAADDALPPELEARLARLRDRLAAEGRPAAARKIEQAIDRAERRRARGG